MPPKNRRTISRWLILPVLWSGVVCFAQTTTTVTQRAKNVQCGNVRVSENGTANLTCSGLTKEQANILQNKIPALLESLITADQELRDDVREVLTANRGGNLPERAIALADSMMRYVCKMDWHGPGALPLPPDLATIWNFPSGRDWHYPTHLDSPQYRDSWFKTIIAYWRFRFGDETVQVHDEFAQLLLRDMNLDRIVRDYKKEQELLEKHQIPPHTPFGPTEIQDVAISLRRMAEKVNPSLAGTPAAHLGAVP
jgi:hypothetical protein